MTVILLQVGGVWLATAFVCGLVARFKNLDTTIWFLRGLAFGAFALIRLLLTPGE